MLTMIPRMHFVTSYVDNDVKSMHFVTLYCDNDVKSMHLLHTMTMMTGPCISLSHGLIYDNDTKTKYVAIVHIDKILVCGRDTILHIFLFCYLNYNKADWSHDL